MYIFSQYLLICCIVISICLVTCRFFHLKIRYMFTYIFFQ